MLLTWRQDFTSPTPSPGCCKQDLKKPFFCVPTDELLRAKDDLLGEGGQSLNSIFADGFGDWFIGIPFVAKCIGKLHQVLKNAQI